MPWSATIELGEAALRRWHADLHAAARLGVLDGVLDEVAERRDQLAAVADAAARSGRSSTAISMPRGCGELADALDRLGDDVADRTALGERRLAELDPRQLHQVVDRPGDTVASATIRSATRCTTSGSLSSASASASTASAPTGVFSSWLMLATKSVRTASSAAALADVLDRRDRRAVGQRLGGDDDRQLRRPVQLEQSVANRAPPSALRRSAA